MPLAIPPELKKISPFVRRAEELDRDTTSPESRLVAYYCRQYAVHSGISLATSAEGKTCLGGLLEQLEKEKPAMDNFTRDEAAFICRKFAHSIFSKADEQDRQGQANKNTAKTFYAAASFLQILEQFEAEGTTEGDQDRKQILYAKWKATDILKALKEGRTPTPGGYGDDADEEEQDGAESEDGDEAAAAAKPPAVETVTESDSDQEAPAPTFDLPSVPVPPPVVPPPPPAAAAEEISPQQDEDDEVEEAGQEVELDGPPPPAYPGGGGSNNNNAPPPAATDRPKLSFSLPPPEEDETPPVPAPVKPPKKSGGGVGGLFGLGKKKSVSVSKEQMADATELTRFALSALQDKDADLAAERLQQALSALGR